MAKQALTEKQKKFIDFYIQSGNASEAARQAGYAEKTAPFIGVENLKKPHIKEAVTARLKELDDKRTADTKEILEYWTSVMRGEVYEEVVAATGTGEGRFKPTIVKKKVGIKDRNKASEMLGKVHGMFNNKIELRIKEPIMIIDDVMSDNES